MRDFINAIPKAELHVHIEGTFEPELLFSIARRNGVSLPYDNVDMLRSAYAFANLQEFLDIYYQGMAALRVEADYFDLTWAYLNRARADGVLHAEIFFDPQAHLARGVAFSTVISGITRALTRGEEEFGITTKLIMCFLRHLEESDAHRVLDMAIEHKESIAGVGLDSSERGHPPSKFVDVFARAANAGFRLTAHAGEEGPPAYVYEALDSLHVERIDHGNRALEDEALTQRLARAEMPLTVCPLSNLKLRVVPTLEMHPLPRMLECGLKVTLNSDDPAYFGGYVNDNIAAVVAATGLDQRAVARLARNSFEASWLGSESKAALLRILDEFLQAYPGAVDA